jgi:tetratricopeptide (TPR) repeat protein
MIDVSLDAALRKLLPQHVCRMLDVWCQGSLRIELDRPLTEGRTAAVVAVVVVQEKDGRNPRRMVMKYLPERKRTRLEFDTFNRAMTEAPTQFRPHLVSVLGERPVPIEQNSTVIFMDYASIGGDEPIALTALLENEALGKACEAVVRSVLQEWNGAAQRRAPRVNADAYLEDLAGWTCQRRGPLGEWLRTDWPELLHHACDHLPGTGRELPNPVHLARFGGALAGREMRAFRGRSHGDLHTDNILIPAAGTHRFDDFRLIDLSTYRNDGPLAFDAAYLICSILAHRVAGRLDDGGPLIELMLDGDGGRSAAFPHDVRDAVLRIASTCRESISSSGGWTVRDWTPNLLLALTGTALIYAGRDLPAGPQARRWFLKFAARAAAAALSRLPVPVPRDTDEPARGPAAWERLIDEAGFRILVLSGPEGVGKTHAVRRRLEALQLAARDDLVVHPVDIHTGSTFGAADLVAALEEALDRGRRAVPRASGRESNLLLGRLDSVLDQLGGRRVVVALDSADHLIDASWTLRDVRLDEALQLLSDRDDHEVSVLLVGRPDPAMGRRGWLGDAEVHSFGKGMAVDELRTFYAALDRKGVYRTADFDDEAWRELRKRTDGNPRAGEMAFALLDFAESGFATVGDVAALLADVAPEDALDVLFQEILPGLTDLQRRVLLALAVYRIPVGADAVHAVAGYEYSARSVADALRKLAARNVIRFDDKLFYLRDPDDERVLGKLGGDAVRRELGLRAEAYLAGLPDPPVERLRDLWVHRARIDILISCGEFDRASSLMHEIEVEPLSKWGYGWLLIDQRERIHHHLDDPRHQLANLNWLGKEYMDVARLDKAEECYRKAMGLADLENDWPGPKRLLTNLAGVLFQRRKTGEAIRTYQRALSMARRENDTAEEVAPLEGLADCRRRHGGFAVSDSLLMRALRLAGGPERPTAEVVRLSLKLARRDVECGRYQAAGTRLGLVEHAVDENADPATACQLYDIDADRRMALGRVDLALAQANRAATLADSVGDPRVLVQARSTLAAVHLRRGRPDDARPEVEIADRRRAEGDSLLVLGVKAIVWHLLGDRAAVDAFARLRGEAFTRRDRDEQDFGAWDFEGLAICGLFLNDRADLSAALYAFDRARRVCRPAGLVDQLGEFLTSLDEGKGRLGPAIAAAVQDRER